MLRLPSLAIGGLLAQLFAMADDAGAAAWEPFLDDDELDPQVSTTLVGTGPSA